MEVQTVFRLGRSGGMEKQEVGRQLYCGQEIQESWDHRTAVVWVGVSVCSCMHMFCPGAGEQAGRRRHRETSALDPRAGLECV